jgi:secondary thiamine-phosphate synthase enzyme
LRTRINLQTHRRRELVDITAQDGNGDAQIRAGLVGPSETVPLIDGELGLSTWQGIFFCEFDGPRASRTVVCTVIADVGHTD